MHDAHLRHLAARGNLDNYRYMLACRTLIFDCAERHAEAGELAPLPGTLQGFFDAYRFEHAADRATSRLTPLHFAIMSRDPAAVAGLLSNGADARARTQQEGLAGGC
eukprot:gene3665-6401_t